MDVEIEDALWWYIVLAVCVIAHIRSMYGAKHKLDWGRKRTLGNRTSLITFMLFLRIINRSHSFPRIVLPPSDPLTYDSRASTKMEDMFQKNVL